MPAATTSVRDTGDMTRQSDGTDAVMEGKHLSREACFCTLRANNDVLHSADK